jgi:DNA polymerase III subunit beta
MSVFDLTVPQANLQSILRSAGRGISSKAAHPVLQGILLVAEDGLLAATGYDLALGVRSATKAIVQVHGSVVAPYRMLSALVAALPEGSMVRLLDDGTGALRLEAGEGRYSVALSHEPEDFPALPVIDGGEEIALPFGSIKRALSAVAYAASNEEHKQALCGIEFRLKTGDFRFMGTDGTRASIYSLPGIAETGEDSSFIVPTAAVKEILKLGLADDDLLLVSQTNAFALFDAGDTAIITNLLAGSIPNFGEIAARTVKALKAQITADRQALISAVERASVVANVEAGTVSISYDPATGDLSISASNDAGSAADLVPAHKGAKGQAWNLRLLNRFIMDALRHVETEAVSIAFSDPRMVLVSPVGSALHQQMLATIVAKAAEG